MNRRDEMHLPVDQKVLDLRVVAMPNDAKAPKDGKPSSPLIAKKIGTVYQRQAWIINDNQIFHSKDQVEVMETLCTSKWCFSNTLFLHSWIANTNFHQLESLNATTPRQNINALSHDLQPKMHLPLRAPHLYKLPVQSKSVASQDAMI